MMKRGLALLALFGFVFMIFGLGDVHAQTYSCGPNEEIFRISSASNAHGGTWNGSSYITEICYNEAFGQAYVGPGFGNDGVHNANGSATNKAIRLSGLTNAHAEGPEGANPGYIDVYFGDLACRTGTGSPLTDEVEIASLSGTTNAHIGTAGQYVNKIFCKSPSASISPSSCALTGAVWDVTTATEGQAVGLTITGADCDGQTVNFEMREDEAVGSNPAMQNASSVSFSGNSANAVWIAEWIDDGAFQGDPEYFFIASLASNPAENIQSSDPKLEVSQAGPESPKANVTAPVHRGIYFKGETVTFSQNAELMAPQNFDFEWGILENDEAGFSNATTTDGTDFQHTFTNSGQKTIRLKVSDPATGRVDEHEIAILVVESPGIFAFIESPRHREVVSEVSGEKRVEAIYSALDSFVVDSEDPGTGPVVDCLAGNCPSQTENSPGGGGQITVNNPTQGFSNLNFEWTFDDGFMKEGLGIENANGTKIYTSRGDKSIDLTLSYNVDPLSLEKTVSRNFVAGQCIDRGKFIVLKDPLTGRETERIPTTQEGACDSIAGTCCPAGQFCDTSGETSRCVIPTEGDLITRCGDYTSQGACELDPNNVAESEGNQIGINCGGIDSNGALVECQCEWDTTGGQCVLDVTRIDQDTGENDWTCLYESSESACNQGYQTITISSTFVPGPSYTGPINLCEGGEKTILCGRPSFELGFFGYQQFLAALIVIFVIYLIVINERKIKHEK